MNRIRGFALTELIVVIVWLAAAGGWIANIVKVVSAISEPVTGMFIARCIGVIVAPLGAVLGYL